MVVARHVFCADIKLDSVERVRKPIETVTGSLAQHHKISMNCVGCAVARKEAIDRCGIVGQLVARAFKLLQGAR